MLEEILLKPSMVTPSSQLQASEEATPKRVAGYNLKLLYSGIPPAMPGIMASDRMNLNFLSRRPKGLHDPIC